MHCTGKFVVHHHSNNFHILQNDQVSGTLRKSKSSKRWWLTAWKNTWPKAPWPRTDRIFSTNYWVFCRSWKQSRELASTESTLTN